MTDSHTRRIGSRGPVSRSIDRAEPVGRVAQLASALLQVGAIGVLAPQDDQVDRELLHRIVHRNRAL
jgi:hypothetical protein